MRWLQEFDRQLVLAGMGGLVFATVLFFVVPRLFSYSYSTGIVAATSTSMGNRTLMVTHISTPDPLKAIYISSWVAGTKDWRADLVRLIDDTEINAVVIDIKDFTGKISFKVSDPELSLVGSWEDRIPDLGDFIRTLHEKNIYVIGRISVFQDPFYSKQYPEVAVRRASDGAIWKDFKGISFTDPGSERVWKYTTAIAKESWKRGFDELNFDYIRFPSDGNMKDISFASSGTRTKPEVLKNFFAYLSKELKDEKLKTDDGQMPKISADLFGMTTTNTDDLNIGQVLENALPYFDYVMPMVYPSHYPSAFHGWKNPAEHPYEVVQFSMVHAVERARALAASASTTPDALAAHVSPAQLRPWLQDFNLGAVYTADMVRAQIRATYDAGLTSWALWDAGNTYTRGALLSE